MGLTCACRTKAWRFAHCVGGVLGAALPPSPQGGSAAGLQMERGGSKERQLGRGGRLSRPVLPGPDMHMKYLWLSWLCMVVGEEL